MDNLIQLAMQILFCLLIAAILGAIIGYLLGKMSKCDKDDYDGKELNSYDNAKDSAKSSLEEIQSKPSVTAALAVEAVVPDNDTQIGQEIGNRPYVLTNPQKLDIDDLKEVSGVGLKIEEALNNLGVYRFEQIANWSNENIEWIENYLVFKGRIKKEDWIGQAKLLFAGGETKFSKKVRSGNNPNYN